jgi:hypothetical protein
VRALNNRLNDLIFFSKQICANDIDFNFSLPWKNTVNPEFVISIFISMSSKIIRNCELQCKVSRFSFKFYFLGLDAFLSNDFSFSVSPLT